MTKDDELKFEGKEKTEPIKIPVVFLTKDAVKKYLNDNDVNLEINLNVAIGDKKRTGHNVIGLY